MARLINPITGGGWVLHSGKREIEYIALPEPDEPAPCDHAIGEYGPAGLQCAECGYVYQQEEA